MGIFTVSAILASTLVLAPVTPTVEALAGLTQLREGVSNGWPIGMNASCRFGS